MGAYQKPETSRHYGKPSSERSYEDVSRTPKLDSFLFLGAELAVEPVNQESPGVKRFASSIKAYGRASDLGENEPRPYQEEQQPNPAPRQSAESVYSRKFPKRHISRRQRQESFRNPIRPVIRAEKPSSGSCPFAPVNTMRYG